jgi:hypothetical protein
MKSKLLFLGILTALAMGLIKYPLWTNYIIVAIALVLSGMYIYAQCDIKHRIRKYLELSFPDFEEANNPSVLSFSSQEERLLGEEFVHKDNFSLYFSTSVGHVEVESILMGFFQEIRCKVCHSTEPCDLCSEDLFSFTAHQITPFGEKDYVVHINCDAGVYQLMVNVQPWDQS